MRGAGGVHRVCGDRRAATTLEFALIAMGGILPTFFFIFNVGIQLFTQATLEQAVFAAARQIRIGSSAAATSSSLRTYMCTQLAGAPLNCNSVQIYATAGTSFASLTQSSISHGNLSIQTYTPGSPNNYVLLQVAYLATAPLPMPLFNSTFMSVAVFRNEP